MKCYMIRNYLSFADKGPSPYVANIDQESLQNQNYRTAIWTGEHLQMTLMCIPPCSDIGLELHNDVDQFIRIEQGKALAEMGIRKNQVDFRQNMYRGDGVFIPAGTWHNITNMGKTPLKLSVIYAPPNHPRGTVHRTKSDAEEN